MDSLHTVLRSIRGETKSRADHLTVFREFLDQLDRVGRAAAKSKAPKGGKPARRRSRRKR